MIPPSDPCQPSLNLLRAACTRWFRKKGFQGRLLFPDCGGSWIEGSTDDPVEVVFFGSFLRRFLESAYWYIEPRRYRLWVLCEASREVMAGLMGVPSRLIGVVPRYELFPAAKRQRGFPGLKEPFTLVYSGRVAPCKNVEILLRMVSFLQTEHSMHARLVLFSRFDNEGHPDRPKDLARLADYRERILGLGKSLPWTHRPRFVENLGPKDWYRERLRSPVLASFSTFMSEDFGVSIAQAQSLGWPCLLSDWGAHRDVRGPGVRKIPVSLIAARDGDPWIDLRARRLAVAVRAAIQAPPQMTVPAGELESPPGETSGRRLDGLRRRLIETLGPGAIMVARSELPEFGATPLGARFFARYRRAFGGLDRKPV